MHCQSLRTATCACASAGASVARWQRGYARVYVLPNSLKSALIPCFAGIPQRIGYVGESRYGLLNETRKLDPLALPRMVDRYYALALTRAEAAHGDGAAPLPRLLPDRAAAQRVRQRLALAGNTAPVIFCPGAEYGPAKRWPIRHFAHLARQLGETGQPVWIMGAAKDHAVAEEIRAHDAGLAINLCGKTALAEAIDLMSLAAGVVTNDSGLMHVAAALGVATVALFGSSSARFTPPLSAHARVLSLDLACSPCFERECPLGHLDCLEKLTPDTVFAALAQLQTGA